MRLPALAPLPRRALPVDAAALARWLIGTTLVRRLPEGRRVGRIVETEAYVVGDAASHAYRGETPRNRAMFLAHGHAYVYLIYGMWTCLNVSAEPRGVGAGVLIRALEPLAGFDDEVAPARVASGPGRLALALRVGRDLDGIDLCRRGPLWLAPPVRPVGAIGTSVRIGLSREAERPLRFFERGSPALSGPRRLNA